MVTVTEDEPPLAEHVRSGSEMSHRDNILMLEVVGRVMTTLNW